MASSLTRTEEKSLMDNFFATVAFEPPLPAESEPDGEPDDDDDGDEELE